MKFTIEMAEKETELLERYGSEAGSSLGSEDKSGILTWPQMSGKEKIDRWSTGLDAKPLNPQAADFVPERNPLAATTVFPGSIAKAKIAEKWLPLYFLDRLQKQKSLRSVLLTNYQLET